MSLTAWASALANVGTAQARVFWIGDSIMEGTGSSTRAKRALDLIIAKLVTDYPVSGQGQSQYLPAVYGCPTSGQATNTTWGGLWATVSGTVAAQLSGISGGTGTPTTTFGPGQRSVNLTGTSATLTYTVTGTVADLWFAAGGSFTYSVDGAAFSAAVDTSTWDANAQLYPITLGTSGTHTVAIRRSSGTVRYLGMTVFDGSRTKGVAMFDACHWGGQIIDFWSYSNSSAPQNAKLSRNIALLAPQLVVINVLINDAGNIGQQGITECMNRLTGMLAAVQAAAPSASIAFCLPYDQVPDSQLLSDGNTIGQLKSTVATWVSTNGLTYINLSTSMPPVYSDTGGNYQSDGMHMTDTGDALAASLIYPQLEPAATGNTATGAATAPAASASGVASVTAKATGAATAPAATASGSAKVTSAATGSATAPAATASGSATVTAAATGAATAPAATAAGVAGSGASSASGNAIAPSATAAGTAKVTSAANGSGIAPTATASGQVSVTAAASGSTIAPQAIAAGVAGSGNTSATGSAVAPAATAGGSATVTALAVGSAIAAAATSTGAASVTAKAAGQASAPAASASGSATAGTGTATATGSAVAPNASATGTASVTTTGNVIAFAPRATAAGRATTRQAEPSTPERTVVFAAERRTAIFEPEQRTALFPAERRTATFTR